MSTVFALLFMTGLAAAAQPPAGKAPRPKDVRFAVGDPAPKFELRLLDGKKDQTVKLEDLKGKPVVLVFGSCT